MHIKNDRPMYSLTVGEYIQLHQEMKKEVETDHTTVGSKEKDLLNISEAAQYLDMAVSSLYSMNSRRQIPFSKVAGKVYYRRSALDAWLASGERKTIAQLKREVMGGNAQ